jgi:hypothetical protein
MRTSHCPRMDGMRHTTVETRESTNPREDGENTKNNKKKDEQEPGEKITSITRREEEE